MRGCWWLCKHWLSKSVNHSGLGWPLHEGRGALGIQRRDAEWLTTWPLTLRLSFISACVEVPQLRGTLIICRAPSGASGACEKGSNGAEIFRLISLSPSMMLGDYMVLCRRVFCWRSPIMQLIPRFAVMCAVVATLKWKSIHSTDVVNIPLSTWHIPPKGNTAPKWAYWISPEIVLRFPR